MATDTTEVTQAEREYIFCFTIRGNITMKAEDFDTAWNRTRDDILQGLQSSDEAVVDLTIADYVDLYDDFDMEERDEQENEDEEDDEDEEE